MRIIGDKFTPPFRLVSDREAWISSTQCAGLSFFGEFSYINCLTVHCLAALTQLTALALNPVLVPEDLPCSEVDHCLFATRWGNRAAPFVLARNAVCDGCRHFYEELGVAERIFHIDRTLDGDRTG